MNKMTQQSTGSVLTALGAFAGAAGVAAGAIGAHFLHDYLEKASHLGTWNTAVLYNLVHVVAIIGVGLLPNGSKFAGWLWLAGVVLFSGSLYALSLGAPKWIGPITPLGGTALIVGWLWLAISQLSSRSRGDA